MIQPILKVIKDGEMIRALPGPKGCSAVRAGESADQEMEETDKNSRVRKGTQMFILCRIGATCKTP